MAGQQRVYTDEEIAKLEALEKAKKSGLTDLEILRLEQKSKSVKTEETPLKTRRDSFFKNGYRVDSSGRRLTPGELQTGVGFEEEPIGRLTAKDVYQASRKVLGGVLSYPASIAAAGWASPYNPAGPRLPMNVAEKFGNVVGGAITGEPETEPGKRLAEGLNAPLNAIFGPISQGIDWTAKKIYPENESGQAGVRTGLGAALLILPYLGKGMYQRFVKARVESGVGITPKELSAVIEKNPGIPKDVLAKIEPTRQGFLSEPTTIPEDITIPSSAPSAPKIDSRKIVIDALGKAEFSRGLQEAINAQERSIRIPAMIEAGQKIKGEAGWLAQKKVGSGAFEKAQYEGIRDAVGPTPEARQAVINDIFQQIQDSNAISETQKFSAKAGAEDMFNGRVPQEQKLVYLNKVFGDEFVKAILSKRSTLVKMKDLGIEIANIPRAVMASTDLSFGLRQGLMMATRHPIIFWRDWVHQFTKGGKDSFRVAQEELVSRPTYRLAERYDLALTDVGKIIKQREEQFASPLAERIPVAGKVVGWSNRVYTAFANRLRMDTFDYYVKRATDLGRDVWSENFNDWMHKKGLTASGMEQPQLFKLREQFGKDIKLGHDIAKIVNNGTGRGTFGKLGEDLAPAMNALMFSPRLFMSRFNTLLNPVYYIKLDKFARIQQLKMTASMVGTGITTLYLLKKAGLDVGVDPSSADFGKIKIGNTRIDIWGGYQQYAALIGKILTNSSTSSITGKTSELNKGFGSPSRGSATWSFIKGKLAPIPSFAVSLWEGSNVKGEKFDIGKGLNKNFLSFDWMKNPVASMFIPMVIQDMADIAKDDPGLIPLSALGVFGVGLNTYSKEKKTIDQNLLDRLRR